MDEKQDPGSITLPDSEIQETGREPLDEERAPSTTIPVVAIGASAGGLEVVRRLLAELHPATGFAFVFVQHLDPSHHSLLSEILSRATTIPVHEAADGMPLVPNHVFVIPEKVDLTVSSGLLKLTPRTQTPGPYMPIDRFLRSVAEQCGNRAIGIILSGTGTDGSAGMEAIKAAGGVTFAQDAASARFPAMPQAAIATGCVDFVLPPERIAAELARIAHHPYLESGAPAPPEFTPDDELSFSEILKTLCASTNIDFSLYREKMIKRRILRRLALGNIDTLAEYSKRLVSEPAELAALHQDLLISVTSFFRDRESFAVLKTLVFPALLRGRQSNDALRLWVAGCATGEEAYSIAISLLEYLTDTGISLPIQIFASDLSLAAIEKARAGHYLENIEADVSPERLNRYFTRIESGYQVNKNLREMCVFTKHNLIDDPPFSKLDLISCRNVLIYLGNVRNDIISLFHYALKPTGYLLLGASEGPAADDLFSTVNAEHRLFVRKESTRKSQLFQTPSRSARRSAAAPFGADLWDGGNVRKEVDRILLSKYSPSGVVVDADLEVLEIRGKANAYLTLPAGKVSFNLIKLIPDTGLFLAVEKLIAQVRQTGEIAHLDGVRYDHDGISRTLNLQAMPLDSTKKHSTLVLFEPAAADDAPPSGGPAQPAEIDPKTRQITLLKQQLAEAKERFCASVEAHQTSREEIQNTTEEALSANEELQSLNEELETAKEELQSTNEELITVNEELHAKNAALAQARDFAMSIVETVGQPLLVLDANLRIQIANRAFYRTFPTSKVEAEGRVVYTLSRGDWDIPVLRTALDSLLQNGNAFQDLEVQWDFAGLGSRSLVFGGCHINHLKMILLAIDDITENKLAQQALRKSEEHLRQAQKMEAVGRLAGGIAHDFNNLLTAILGYSDLLLDNLHGDRNATSHLREIKAAAERAASLTQQLLAFSRRQVLQPKVLDLNSVLADFDKMLRRLVGERIVVSVNCADNLWCVQADPGEIGRAIMNLWLNARDAMPLGGTLSVETANVTVAENDTPSRTMPLGRYVTLTVRDTGVGMDPEMQSHIFEPFFTTKNASQGTGLGLATVLGIVEQSGGYIQCESQVGSGTSFHIFLPAIAAVGPQADQPSAGLGGAPAGTESVLLVEDEESIRRLSRVILERSGYVVLDAANGEDALELCRKHQGPIDLLVTDVMMPGVGGRELAESALKLRPALRVIFMSGHTEDVLLREGILKGAPFLQKPFTLLALAQKVRETLDAR